MVMPRPAWSEQFNPDALARVSPLLPLDAITPEWAFDGATGRGIKVAIVDSGIEGSHPAVGGQLRGGVVISQGADGLEYDLSEHDDAFGHGTACAGIIHTLAPECELYSVRVLGARLTGQSAVLTAGLRWAVDNGMHVCNLSLGTPKKDYFGLLHEIADMAAFRSVMFVAAANNIPVPSFPSVFASVISVASHDLEDPYVIYFNPRPPVEFGAPGINVRVAWRDGGYLTATGNSFAAPHITGIVAKILSKHPELNLWQMKVVLRALSANILR